MTFVYPNSANPMAAPTLLPEMLDIAERLGRGIDFVRVDLYCLEDRVERFSDGADETDMAVLKRGEHCACAEAEGRQQ